MLTLELLPKEILVKIFSQLSFTDLKQAVAVSRRFCDVGTERKLWKHFKLFVSGRNIKHLRNILKLKILRDLHSIVFLGCILRTEHVRLVLRSSVTAVQLGKEHELEFDCDLSTVSPIWLGKLVEKIQVFKFNNSARSELTEKQASILLAKLNGRSNLKKLEIFHPNNLSFIRPDQLASALTSLTELTLGLTPPRQPPEANIITFYFTVFQKLTSEMYDGIFYNIYKNSNLEVLNLPGNDLSGVNPDLFGSAISKVISANLSDTGLSGLALRNLLKKLRGNSSILRSLDLSHNKAGLGLTRPDILAEAVTSLDCVSLKMNTMTEAQVCSLLSVLATSSRCQLKDLNLSGICSVCRVPPHTLATAIVKLRRAVMYATKLTQYQLQHILTTLGRRYLKYC